MSGKSDTPSDSHGSVNPEFHIKKSEQKTIEEYTEGIRAGDRSMLSQAITLTESSRPDHQSMSEEILEQCLPYTGQSVRIGITGVPGVGKSTFIEALGKNLTEQGESIAVLTVDPSSSRSRGSILGDKTRMPFLSSHPDSYVRPSPASGTLGGVAGKTRETMLLCEAAGFSTIFVETVGVGQSETAVQSMTDFFLLLMLPGAGDELQGIKRGIMEMADLIAINKAEKENQQAAKQAKLEYKNALSLFPPHPSGWKPPVLTCSALENEGIREIWQQIENYFEIVRKSGFFEKNRKEQAVYWMHETIENRLRQSFYQHPHVRNKISEIEQNVAAGKITPVKAAGELLTLTQT
jgi:LAO/AO transport system kinase